MASSDIDRKYLNLLIWLYIQLEGKKEELINPIKDRYKVGLSRLPAYGFSMMFRQKQEELITESMKTMQNWLGNIKQPHIVHQVPNRLQDEYFSDGALNKSSELHV